MNADWSKLLTVPARVIDDVTMGTTEPPGLVGGAGGDVGGIGGVSGGAMAPGGGGEGGGGEGEGGGGDGGGSPIPQ